MMQQEFEKLMGFEISTDGYALIEKIYMDHFSSKTALAKDPAVRKIARLYKVEPRQTYMVTHSRPIWDYRFGEYRHNVTIRQVENISIATGKTTYKFIAQVENVKCQDATQLDFILAKYVPNGIYIERYCE